MTFDFVLNRGKAKSKANQKVSVENFQHITDPFSDFNSNFDLLEISPEPTGLLYNGNFQNGKISGEGTLHSPKSVIFGKFRDNMLEGKGMAIFKN
jgi:hypothetical protein